jgi:serine/threonine protein kinase
MEDYQLLLRLGAGSFAVVWKARRISDGSLVAIKQLKDTSLTWDDVVSMPEIKQVQGLDHPNILKALSVVRLGCITYIILEYCEINVLQIMNTMMASGKRFSEPEIRWIMRQCLKGLSYMHSHGVLHRDIKPENMLLQSDVMCGGNPGLKLCDFGQAKDASAATFTDYVATRWYRAPELLLHASRYDGGVDIFAAGVMMAELFTLRPVFAGTSEVRFYFVSCLQFHGHHHTARGCRWISCFESPPPWDLLLRQIGLKVPGSRLCEVFIYLR